jgi:hypothetical protein
MTRAFHLSSASLATLLAASLSAFSGCGAASNNTKAELETPMPPPSPPEEPGSDVPAAGTGTGPASTGTGSNNEGPSSPSRGSSGSSPGGSVVGPSGGGGVVGPSGGGVNGPSSKADPKGSRGRLACVEFASCNVDKPCDGGLHCVRVDGCMSALCMSPKAACQANCGKNDCSILESYPAQVSCNGGPGEPPGPEPDVIADAERSPR